MTVPFLAALVFLGTGCAQGPRLRHGGEAASATASAAISTPAASAEGRCRIVSRVDHHQHLLSPAGAALANRPPLPAVELPQDLARLLRQIEERWNDKAALADLYTEDSVVLSTESPGWIRGRDGVAAYLGTRFARAYRLTPVIYRVQGAAGHVAGYFTRGEGAAAKPFGHFLLELDKDRDGVWRIAAETPTFPGPVVEEPETAEQLVAFLDAACIRRAVVLSDAYWFDSPKNAPVADAYVKVRAENEWTAEQAARFPDRLVAFCSFNPLAEYALAEVDRCASDPRFKGLKLHFGMSVVDLKNPEHVEKVRRVFEAANRRRLSIIVHVRADQTYGREHAEILLSQLLPAAPDIPVQIAHLWGGEAFSDSALAAYADAVSAGRPATKNLYFDVAEAVLVAGGSEETLRTIAQRIRQIGLRRILYGTDGPVSEALSPREGWDAFRTKLPLTEEELRTIADNVAPYLR
jgi:predicted TIM-barrel fold metal-dependent hydrolase